MSNILEQITILYEDADMLAINKPAGLMVHADGRSKGPFLTDWVISKYPQAKDVGDPARSEEGESLDRSGIVHRLDRETSGVLLVAKSQKGFEYLKDQFKDRTLTKKYLAFVWGEIGEEFGTINRPIGRSKNDFRKWSAQRGTRGDTRDAETYWTRMAVIDANSFGQLSGEKRLPVSVVQCEPKTGRTHQLRVHFNAIHHPVVGDMLYAPKKPFALGFERTALHANWIQFQNMEGKTIKIVAPLPDDFAKVVEHFAIKIQ